MTSEMGEAWNEIRSAKKERKRQTLLAADPSGWTQHTTYYWSRQIAGHQLDYWPSTKKFQYQGRVLSGDVERFIRNILDVRQES